MELPLTLSKRDQGLSFRFDLFFQSGFTLLDVRQQSDLYAKQHKDGVGPRNEDLLSRHSAPDGLFPRPLDLFC